MLPVLGMRVRGRVIGIDMVRHGWARLIVLEGLQYPIKTTRSPATRLPVSLADRPQFSL
jgi:hypothetical protein